MPVSIQDVAKRASVSISTVSRVLNRRNIVNETTRKRVEEAITELGYQPNVFARGLMLRRSHVLGLVLPDLHGEFYSEIIRGANVRARELGYKLMISSVAADDDGSELMATVADQALIDGVAVMVSEVDARTRATLSAVKGPLVVLDGEVLGVKHDSVVIDQRMGAVALIRHLVERRSARRLVFVGGLPTNFDTMERLAAAQEVTREAGVALEPGDIFHLDYLYDTAFELGQRKVREWSHRRASVFAANDEMAAGIIDAAIDAGLSVPDDLPVVGFDDTRIAAMTRPRLTTVRVPMSSMGAAAIDLLFQRITDPKRPAARLTLQSELVVRESCGAPEA
ncbi:MAG: LacI family DNA-binding transcriptional regulator [Pirellulales bacterium]|nr:LacI family DNA-binding transcriptional regulator [Pirellulales bacterium]